MMSLSREKSSKRDNRLRKSEMRTRRKTRSKGNRTKRPSNNPVLRRINRLGETKLHAACIAGNIEQVIELLESNHPAGVRDYCGWTPLHEAAYSGHDEIAELLIKAGANVNDLGGERASPLHDAASCGHFSMMLLLINNGADIWAKTKDGETILDCLKAWKNSSGDWSPGEQRSYDHMLSKLSKLLQLGPKKSSTRESFNSPPPNSLHVEEKRLEASELNDEIIPIGESREFEDAKKVEERTESSENESECSTIIAAVCGEDAEVLEIKTETEEENVHQESKRFSNNNGDRETFVYGETELHVACKAGNIAQVTKLLESNYPTYVQDYCGWTPLHEAANHGHVEIAQLLIKSGADVNDPGGPMCGEVTPLHVAASGGHLSMVQLLIKNGADLRAKTRHGDTILSCFEVWKKPSEHSSQEEQRVYNTLLSNLSAILKKTPEEWQRNEPPRARSPEMVIINEDQPTTSQTSSDNVKYHLRQNRRKISDKNWKYHLKEERTGSSVQDDGLKRNLKGETKLHIACIAGNIERVTKLLESDHPTDVQDHYGWTPLQEAANRGHLEIVELLIKHGANVDDPGGPKCEGLTPLHDAASLGHFSTMFLLIEKGANLQAKTRAGVTILDRLESWKKRSNDMSLRQRAEYGSLHSILSAVLPQNL